jgi:hypothetical protein
MMSEERQALSIKRRKTTLRNAYAKYSFGFEWGGGVI